jgi:NADH-quinone oxidoreductase subunit H
VRPHAPLLLAPLAVGAVLLIGVYLVAVLDRALGAWVAGRSLRPAELLAAPVREAALQVLQQRTRTERSDAEAWALAPALLAALAAAGVAVVPLGPAIAVADVRSGIVLFGAAVALVMVAVFLNGWSANSFFPLLGAYRFVALALSYEMPFALVLIAAALPAESLAVGEIVRSQAGLWNVLRQPLGLPIYLATALGIAFWGPLDLPDAEDLAGGTRAELSGMPLLLWRAARSAVLVAVAAMGAAVFLGGWQGPWLLGPAWMALKTLALLAVLLLAGHLLPRVRQERFVIFGWVVLIPLALVDIFLSGLLLLL